MNGKVFLSLLFFTKKKGEYNMNYSYYIGLAVDILKVCYPIAIIFGLTAKLTNFSLDLMFNRKISL